MSDNQSSHLTSAHTTPPSGHDGMLAVAGVGWGVIATIIICYKAGGRLELLDDIILEIKINDTLPSTAQPSSIVNILGLIQCCEACRVEP